MRQHALYSVTPSEKFKVKNLQNFLCELPTKIMRSKVFRFFTTKPRYVIVEIKTNLCGKVAKIDILGLNKESKGDF